VLYKSLTYLSLTYLLTSRTKTNSSSSSSQQIPNSYSYNDYNDESEHDNKLTVNHRLLVYLDTSRDIAYLFFYRNCEKIVYITWSCHKHTAIKFTQATATRERHRLLLLLV